MQPNQPRMGRARGRARAATDPAQRPGAEPGRAQPQAGQVPPVQQQVQPAMRRPGPSDAPLRPGLPPSQHSMGRASTARRPEERSQAPTSEPQFVGEAGAGDVSSTAGRGAMRGRRLTTNVDLLRTRPDNIVSKQGVSGRPVRLMANYFRLLTQTDWCLYQYRVDFSPEEDRTFIRKAMLRNHKDTIGGYIFDGTVLYCSQRLTPDPVELTSTRKTDGSQVLIKIKMVSQLVMGDYQYIQFFNILIRKCFEGLKLQLVGRNFYDALAKVEIRQYGLQLWPGYLTSIRQHEHHIMMCSEITHKVMRMRTAYDILVECKSSRTLREEYEKQMIGTTVLTDYNNKTYRVDSIDWQMTPSSTFKKKTGEEVTFVKYYQERYGVPIKDVNQPMLISRSKDKDLRSGLPTLQALIPELCRTTGLTEEMKANFQLMRAMSDHTRVNPDLRVQKLMDFNRRLRNTPETQAELKEWQMELDQKLVDFGGRVLPSEKILLGVGRSCAVNRDVDWTKDLRSNAMLRIMHIKNWHVIFPKRNRNETLEFIKILQRAASSMHLNIAQPSNNEIADDRNSTYVEQLERILSGGQTPDLIMCVVPNNRGDRYSAIKKKTCVDRSVPTQVIVSKNLTSKGVMSIATKVAIQINCKVGGAPWSVEIPVAGLMVFGFDVCHDASNKSLSYGALVATLDKSLTKYFTAVSNHSQGEELANDMVINVTKAIHKFKQHNGGALPQRIVFYRDGVGDGQIPYVLNQEVELIKNLFNKIYEGNPVRFAYIIVSKRINTRIFTINRQNPEPGTVVDDVITLPERYDFFLISQTVRQGTVSPTSYNVIYDTLGFDPDKIQRLSYKLTHMYFNWSGTCRVPAPCQYAHKLAFLVGQSLHRSPNQSLDESLYFL